MIVEQPLTPGLTPQKLTGNEIVYSSYAGVDIVAQIILPNEAPLVLGELQTISYSMHRENTPVRIVGHTSPRGFVRGPRTIAGSMIFTMFNTYAFYRLEKFRNAITSTRGSLFPLADMLPAFDVAISFANETGSFSQMRIFGISIIDEGTTMSVDDLITEQTYTYMARGIQPMIHYYPNAPGGEPQALGGESTDVNVLRLV